MIVSALHPGQCSEYNSGFPGAAGTVGFPFEFSCSVAAQRFATLGSQKVVPKPRKPVVIRRSHPPSFVSTTVSHERIEALSTSHRRIPRPRNPTFQGRGPWASSSRSLQHPSSSSRRGPWLWATSFTSYHRVPCNRV